MNPQYPVYVISKGRWESRLTAKSLERMNIPFNIVVEPKEYSRYASVIDKSKILAPCDFSELGQGSIPVRNWVWEHALDSGAERHWILDDNIDGFVRLNRNSYYPLASGTAFKVAEDFVERYENVAIAGFHYRWLCKRKQKLPPFYKNRRVYSCILLRNDLPYRWRGRYNEDTDLSLRILKDGWCSILFIAFLANKASTMTMKGGNTDELYKDEGRLEMAKSLAQQHPDVCRVNWKWGRWQHEVDYSAFKRNQLVARSGLIVTEGTNDYGMQLVSKKSVAVGS